MGIDYGLGQTNVDKSNGIRFGVISANKVDYWDDAPDVDAYYGEPHCPKCGNGVVDLATDDSEDFEDFEDAEGGCNEHACKSCEQFYDSSEVYGDEVQAFVYKSEGYLAHCSGDDRDIFVEKSPFYTRCDFCSPCAPGAGYLTSEGDDCKAYCFGVDWFEDGKAPYAVYRVDTNECVYTPFVPCDQCNASMVNGTYCHEHGCINAKREVSHV